MNICKTISLSHTATETVLAGATDGTAWYQNCRAEIDGLREGVVAINFTGVRIATVSWLREAVITMLRSTIATSPSVLLIAVNLSDLVREELHVALDACGMVMITADLEPNWTLTNPRMLGRLDPALSETLTAAGDRLTFDASCICRALPHVGASAANNRLASLEAKGVLKSHRAGRNRVYRPVLEGLCYGY